MRWREAGGRVGWVWRFVNNRNYHERASHSTHLVWCQKKPYDNPAALSAKDSGLIPRGCLTLHAFVSWFLAPPRGVRLTGFGPSTWGCLGKDQSSRGTMHHKFKCMKTHSRPIVTHQPFLFRGRHAAMDGMLIGQRRALVLPERVFALSRNEMQVSNLAEVRYAP